MAIPNDWIGRRVQFWLEGAQSPAVGELVEANDQGIVLAFTPQGEGAAQTTFYPWRMVRAITLEPGQSSEVGGAWGPPAGTP
jgi:hypothetical protein